jgi:hypothetical protein
MKKKLRLDDLQVKSFVTSEEAAAVKGGNTDTDYADTFAYTFSCYDFFTCNQVHCIRKSYGYLCPEVITP